MAGCRRSAWPDPPAIECIAHAADLGLTFYAGGQFPESYKNDLFTAQHGSWDRSTPVGAQVMYVDMDENGMDENGNVVSHGVYATGWLDETSSRCRGRPVDVMQAPDGALFVSDDFAGAVYRVGYVGGWTTRKRNFFV